MPTTPFLTIATIPIPVAVNAATERRITRGRLTRAFDNSARSTIDPHTKREWEVTTIPMDPTDVAALLAAAPHGSRVAASGRMIGGGMTAPGAPVTCLVAYGEVPYRKQRPASVKRVLTITLSEA